MSLSETTCFRTRRRSKAQIENLEAAILEFAEAEKPVTVRQVFYHLVGKGLVEKTESQYQNTVDRKMIEMRRRGDLPYEWVADNGRDTIVPATFDGIGDGLNALAAQYREPRWKDQKKYLQVWLEKSALENIFAPITDEFGVPLNVSRGFSSLTFIHEAAMSIRQATDDGKDVVLLFFGDHDASGEKIPWATVNSLRDEHGCTFRATRCLLTEKQVYQLGLPTRPPKPSTHDRGWGDKPNVELDAIPPTTLREILRKRIEDHIDWDAWELSKRKEAASRDRLREIVRRVRKS